MNTTGGSTRANARLMIAPAMALAIVFFVIPLLWCVGISFTSVDPLSGGVKSLTIGNYLHFFTDSFYLVDLLWRTVWLSLVATVLAVVIGYCGALVIVKASERLQPWMLLMVMCPLWVNLVVRTLSLMIVLERDGPINRLLMAMGLVQHPLQLMFNEIAVLIGMIQVSVPFVVITMHAVLKAIDPDLERAALAVGGDPIRAFIKVTLPLSLPGVAAGAVLALGLNLESFVVPVLLGGGKVHFMSVAAYESAMIGNNLPFAATIGIILLIVTLLIMGVYHRLMTRPQSGADVIKAA